MSMPSRPTSGSQTVQGAQAEQGGSGIPGFSGPTRVRLPLFALVALGTVLIGIIPFPDGARFEILLALLIFFLLVTTAFTLPWERFPDCALFRGRRHSRSKDRRGPSAKLGKP